ncbi:MAG: DUF362 domain-containing protein [Synergistaceae bacterium]|nr:DUF362 domain-containing protein [Synergistaceae bacterium]MBP9626531.1 DUF362 domain-containing protein [Synergistaceae bacterium]MBP9957636.1 DUF362 domain-containing protein [Synergistaceae bacterium]
MNQSKVYFTNLRTSNEVNLVNKMEKVAVAAGLKKIPLKDKLVALKVHFGEPGNLSFLRHNYTARLSQIVSASEGKPFVTDANTLYKGERSNAYDHLKAAEQNGYTSVTVGCPVLIADGLRGHDHREIPINLKHFDKAFIASGIAEADVVISINHFKGHGAMGFGGAIKNLGMGCASRDGKNRMHSSTPPTIKRENCVGCNECVTHCAYNAITLDGQNKAVINKETCVGCGQCVSTCAFDAAQVTWQHGGNDLAERVAEYALASVQGKDQLHISFILEVSPLCDCVDHNDIPIVSNIGILASTDCVALDMACVDLVNAAPISPDSCLAEHIDANGGRGLDKFTLLHPKGGWRQGIEYAEKIGLGSTNYELITL